MSETPRAWFHLAQAYLHGAAVLNVAQKPPGGFYGHPVRFLYFHSIELFLKAYLRLRGIEEKVLRNPPYSHGLTKLADEAEHQGLLIVELVRAVCDGAGDFDKPTETRYIKTGPASQMLAHKLQEAAQDLHDRVRAALLENGISVSELPELPIVDLPRNLTIEEAAELLSQL